jgi:hypothetical protein
MKNPKLIFFVLLISLNSVAVAQVVSKDSITTLKQQKEALVISKRVNDNKLKLVKLENMTGKAMDNAVNTSAEAQKSADINGRAADKLTGDAQDKKLAMEAGKSANNAKHDAKQARKAASKLEDVKKEITDLRSKISADESKLSTLLGDKSNIQPDTLPGVIKN